MKKKLIVPLAAVGILIGTATLSSCSSTTEKPDSEQVHEHAEYICPMDCENGKTYDESGTCPVCKMDLAEVEK